MPKVVVVGGGYAGISAATALAEDGFQVELLESRGHLGGRVSSTPASGSFPAPLDNGPHLFMGCYENTWKLFDRLGVKGSHKKVYPIALSWYTQEKRRVSLECPDLPSPLNLLLGLFFSDAFPWNEKIGLCLAMNRFVKKPLAEKWQGKTVGEFLDQTKQGPIARERFWIPFCRAVMNVGPEIAPLAGLAEVLRRVFFGTRDSSALLFPSTPLSDIPFKEAIEWLVEKKRSKLSLNEGITEFKSDERSIWLKTKSGKEVTGDALILAVPPSSLAALWPKGTWKRSEEWVRLGKSPILSVHLIVSKAILEGQMVGLSGASFDWVFNRNANWDWRGEGQYLSFTASAANDLSRLSEKELVDLALKELRDRCSAALDAQVLHSKVTREMVATFVWSLDSDVWRPSCDTPFKNVFLAGDWTDTGLPATIEGACFSGHRAADKVRTYLEKTSKIRS
jgi:zeta-carotene desaturase